ncbi:MAG: carbon monoxide dehydrogenase subunit G [Pseudomonadota bacterium]|jgi:hypothetical protein|nr:carbon monoxide dehydrogenase subunit G [Pseudomonadota bacterium]
MDISGEYHLKVSRQQAWDTLLNPNTLHSCIPGCQTLERLADDHYQARIKTVIGPVRATFDTELHIKDSNPPESYRLEGEGKGGAVGFGKGYANVTLNEDTEGTILRYSATFQVGGRLAQLGSRLVLGVTRKIADDFFDQLTKRIDSEAKRLDQVPPSMAGHVFSLVAIIMLVAVVLIWWLSGTG